MSGKWPGGFINKTAPTVVGPTDGEGGSASGIWTLDQVADYESKGLWPTATLDKELYMWGDGASYGALGLGNTTNYSSPMQVGALVTWKAIAGGAYTSLAIKNDGTMWTWGYNNVGALGTGNTTSYSSPVQIGALTTWSVNLACGQAAASAIKTDGTLWTWGYAAQGQLGHGNTTSISSPVQVGALTTWSKVAMGNSAYHTVAIKTDGTLWTWGMNYQGALGLGNTTYYSSPMQVGALTTWSTMAAGYNCTSAIKTDGTLWAWGLNNNGQLGTGNTTAYSSPVQVGALTTWLSVVSGGYQMLALKTDGTIWGWGYNGVGQLGDGTTTNRSSPVQVGSLTTWSKLAAGYNHFAVIKTDGTYWNWGYNNKGQLGDGTITNRSSPVQVGGLTNWLRVASGGYRHSGGITTG